MDQSSNPAFKKSIVGDLPAATSKQTMTVAGTYIKTFILLVILIISAAASWYWLRESFGTSETRWWPVWIVSLLTLFLGMMISFNPSRAPLLSIPYAILQGSTLGVVSATFSYAYEGIVGQAVFTTLAVFLAVYAGYALGWLRATPLFTRIIITAMLGILMFSLLSWFFSLFSLETPVIYSYGTWGIVFGFVVVLVAALSLVLDFAFIDNASEHKYPKYFEWYGAFGLMVGLVWLYIEILHLLARLAAAQNR